MSDLLTPLELEALREDVAGMVTGPPTDPISSGGEQVTILRHNLDLVGCEGGVTLGADWSITFNDLSGSTTTLWSGPARAIPLLFRRDNAEVVGEQLVRIRDYRIVLPFLDSNPLPILFVDDVISFTVSADPYLIGRPLIITDIQAQSETSQGRIVAKDIGST